MSSFDYKLVENNVMYAEFMEYSKDEKHKTIRFERGLFDVTKAVKLVNLEGYEIFVYDFTMKDYKKEEGIVLEKVKSINIRTMPGRRLAITSMEIWYKSV